MRLFQLTSILLPVVSGLAGCAALSSSKGMVSILVLVPALLLVGLLFLLGRHGRRAGRESRGRNERG